MTLALIGLILGGVPAWAQGTGSDVGSQLLSFLDSLANLIGTGLAKLINLVLPGSVAPELVKPLGYLGLLTLTLLLFGLLEAARRVIWLVVGIGWILMLARILIQAFHGKG